MVGVCKEYKYNLFNYLMLGCFLDSVQTKLNPDFEI